MVTHYSLPKIKITNTHKGTDYQLEGYHTITDVILGENEVSQAIVKATDTKGETFLNKVDIDENLKIEIKMADASSPSWKQVFGGWVFDLTPTSNVQSETVAITARGYGLGLLAMPVGEEYGSESANSSLNTIYKILSDGTHGIIDRWVEKVLNTATDSGYGYTCSKIADVTSDFKYLYWPYKPALNCLDDMIDLISAANAPSAGAHWIVIPDGTTAYLCLATVGSHENPPADIWPTWWNLDQAESTIEVKKDMIVNSFTKQRSEANYILYHGKLRKPPRELWTESTSGWGVVGDGEGYGIYTSSDRVVGNYSIKARTTSDAGVKNVYIYYPSGKDASWDIEKWGGEYNIPCISFYAKRNSEALAYAVYLHSDANNYFLWGAIDAIATADKWFLINIPIGPYCEEYSLASEITGGEWGTMDWSDVDYLKFGTMKTGSSAEIYVDDLYFSGWVLRGARDDTKIGSQKARVKLIIDDVGKDDSGKAADDSYTMAQLAKAELCRTVTTPIIGQIVIPGKEQILPGQLAHIHFGKKNGTYNIDKNMRILRVHHHFGLNGFKSYLTLSDDVTNSRAVQPNLGYNLVLNATNPSFQTRERSSIKARGIDITQDILSKNYST